MIPSKSAALVALGLAASVVFAQEVATDGGSRIAVQFTGGFETDPVDHGRPVALIAAALDVSPEIFRKAFSQVHPAAAGQEPEPEQVRRNKEALMSSLGPLGVTNEWLDTVSGYYRYNRSRGEIWRSRPAAAYAAIRGGVITGFTITNPGAGYSSPPQAVVSGRAGLKVSVTLYLGHDLSKNGSIQEIKLITQ